MESLSVIFLLISIHMAESDIILDSSSRSLELKGSVAYETSRMFAVKVDLMEGYTIKVL